QHWGWQRMCHVFAVRNLHQLSAGPCSRHAVPGNALHASSGARRVSRCQVERGFAVAPVLVAALVVTLSPAPLPPRICRGFSSIIAAHGRPWRPCLPTAYPCTDPDFS
ncbi:MAG: hypothetical protein ACRYF5_12560, partial [Janthinobacterium lividum]